MPKTDKSIRQKEAEATRFELVVRKPVRQFSKLMVSATHPHFLVSAFIMQR